MGWERRGTNGPYYTRSRRVGGRVVREYVGKGPIGEIAARMDAKERAERQATADALRAERRRMEDMESQLKDLCRLVNAVVSASLQAAGYHRHNKGEWRRRRDTEKDE